jgi:hypothetical protein
VIFLSKRSMMLVLRAVVWPVVAGSSVLMVYPVAAHADQTPFSFSLSQNLRRDSNVTRSSDAQSDTISTTAVQGKFDKAYGRQVYSASARLAHVSYGQFSKLDNDATDLSANASSSFASNWSASINGSSSSSLNSPETNPINNRLLRNIRQYRDVGASVQYGNGGTWAVVGSLDHNRLNYSEAQSQYQNSQQSSQSVRLLYNATDLLTFGLGPRWVRTTYPQNSSTGDTKDTNLDFTVNWQVTGLSSLNALLSERQSTLGQPNNRHVNAVTGSVGWGYTPRGRISYGANLTRSTNADRFQYVQTTSLFNTVFSSVQNVAQDTINTSLSLSASAALTGKINTGLTYGLTLYEQSNSVNQVSSQSNSRLQTIGWSTSYAIYRWVGVSCALQTYNQTADTTRPKYSGHSVDCGANFTLDP